MAVMYDTGRSDVAGTGFTANRCQTVAHTPLIILGRMMRVVTRCHTTHSCDLPHTLARLNSLTIHTLASKTRNQPAEDSHSAVWQVATLRDRARD